MTKTKTSSSGRPPMPLVFCKRACWVKDRAAVKRFKQAGEACLKRHLPKPEAKRIISIVFGKDGLYMLQRRRMSDRHSQPICELNKAIKSKCSLQKRALAKQKIATMEAFRNNEQSIQPEDEDLQQFAADVLQIGKTIGHHVESNNGLAAKEIAKQIHQLQGPYAILGHGSTATAHNGSTVSMGPDTKASGGAVDTQLPHDLFAITGADRAHPPLSHSPGMSEVLGSAQDHSTTTQHHVDESVVEIAELQSISAEVARISRPASPLAPQCDSELDDVTFFLADPEPSLNAILPPLEDTQCIMPWWQPIS